MSNELQAHGQRPDSTLYAVLVNATGQYVSGTELVEPDEDDWADYAITMPKRIAGSYYGDMPAVAAGLYTYLAHGQAGEEPAPTDPLRGMGSINWSGTAEIRQSGDVYPEVEGGVLLAAEQGSVAFGQVKIIADTDSEGALQITNTHYLGIGAWMQGGLVGQRNFGGSGFGQENMASGGIGQRNYGPAGGQINDGGLSGIGQHSVGAIGQYNQGMDGCGQQNVGTDAGQSNYGDPGYGVLTAGETAAYEPALALAGADGDTLEAVIAACARVGRGRVHYQYMVRSSVAPYPPLADVTVEVYTDPEMTNMIRQDVTNSFGVVWFWLDPGTYYFKCTKDRVRFVNPDEEIVEDA